MLGLGIFMRVAIFNPYRDSHSQGDADHLLDINGFWLGLILQLSWRYTDFQIEKAQYK